jgi:phytoene dehydrogenase-like protein
LSGNYYDVVVLGMDLGPLVAGAILARRGFRVLVTGQGTLNNYYSCYGYRFAHKPFMLSGTRSPAIERVVDELSIGQRFHQLLSTDELRFQVVLSNVRINVFGSLIKTEEEISRELCLSKDKVAAALRETGRLSSEFEKILQWNLVIPPESFFERRDFLKAEVQNPFHHVSDADFYRLVDVDGDFKSFLETPVRFETGGAESVSSLLSARQAGAWLFDSRAVTGGLDAVIKLLLDNIVAQGGDVQTAFSVSGIDVSRGKVKGVRISGLEDTISCQNIVSNLAPFELAKMVPANLWTKRFSALVQDEKAPVLGYSVNIGVNPDVVPEGMGHTLFIKTGSGLGADLLRVELIPQIDRNLAAINVSCIVPEGEEETINTGVLRDNILDKMRWLIPFLDKNLYVIHSPYDKFGAMDLKGDARGDAPAVPHDEQVARWFIRRPLAEASLGMENLPHRTGIKGLFLSGNQVVSGLSAEGEFLAALGAVKIIQKSNPGRQRIVRSMKSKVEN